MSEILNILENDRLVVSTATAAQTVFAFDFPIQDESDIAVIKVDGMTDVETILTLATHYTVSGVDAPAGGGVTLTSSAIAGDVYLLVGATVLQRVLSVVRSGKFKSKATDADLDRAMLIAQELKRDIGRAWKADFGATGGKITAGPEGKIAGFDARGDLVPVDKVNIATKGTWVSPQVVLEGELWEFGGSRWYARRDSVDVIPAVGDDWILFLAGGSLADGAVDEAKLHSSLQGKLVRQVTSRVALAALSGDTYQAVYLNEAGRKGLFNWDSSDLSAEVTADTAQGIYVAPAGDNTGASGAWVRQHQLMPSIEHFGAVAGGGAADAATNAAAIQKCIDWVQVYGRPRAFTVPVGAFHVSPNSLTITNNIRIVGVNRSSSSLYMVGAGDMFQCGDGISSLNYVTMENVALYGDGSTTQNALKVNNCNNVVLRDMIFRDFGNSGAGVTNTGSNSYGLDCERVWFHDGSYGVYMTAESGNNLRVRSCYCTGQDSASIVVQGGVAVEIRGTIFEDIANATPNNGYGVSIVGITGPVSVDTCYFEDNYQDIAFNQSDGITFSLRSSYFTSSLTGDTTAHINRIPNNAEIRQNRFAGREYLCTTLPSSVSMYDITMNIFEAGYTGVIETNSATPNFGLLQALTGAVASKGLTIT